MMPPRKSAIRSLSLSGLPLAGLLMLGACNAAPDRQPASETHSQAVASDPQGPASSSATTSASPSASPAGSPTALAENGAAQRSGPLSCAEELGATAAQRRADLCRNVSPATRPPCNVANSCAMIEDEIARSCALFDSKGDPMPGCRPAPKSKEAAAAVVERYYSALNARDFGTAWQQWGDDGPPRQTMAQFTAGFAHTRATHVAIGAMEPGDAGAGSVYQTVPVTVDATLDDGSSQRFRGKYVLRRVNGVDGATPGQLRWHIDSAQLSPVR